MNLKTLLAPLQKFQAQGNLDLEITGIAYDSRKIEKNYLFAALPGEHFHGIQFLKQAEAAGAAAVLTDRQSDTSLTHILVDNPRLALAHVSARFYDDPSGKLRLFAVTGTNGKTTTTFLLRSILESASIRCGLLGTVQYSGGSFKAPASLTTPESSDLQRMLAQMLSENCQACVMEASSHSLKLYRVADSRFEAGIFTNLTQDHLDFHHTMEEYFQAKMMLFNNETCETNIAVTNIDDPYGRRIVARRKTDGLSFATYGFDRSADFCVTSWSSHPRGSEITISYGDTSARFTTPLIARYNAYNICSAFATTYACGIGVNAIITGIEKMKQVPGRLERIDLGQPYLILIDYAHTEDALRQLLTTVRQYTRNRLIVLFGCGGERDRGKRPLMGKAAGELAEIVFLTSDNPRSEDPIQIIRETERGVKESGNENLHIFEDRKEAILQAVRTAQPGDALVLAGKGHENYQIINSKKLHFDEREILQEALSGNV